VPAEALALALAAAVIHAVWNFLLAGARDSHAFAAVVLLVGAVVGAPAAALDWHFEAAGWPFLVATCALELAYFVLLAYAYTHSELSLVYPLARGLAPVLVLGGAVVLTSAGTTPRQVGGVLLVCAGILLVRGVGRGRGALLAVAIAGTIATYTVVDKHGVQYISPLAYLELMSLVTGIAYAAWIVVGRDAGALRAELTWRSVAAGIGTFAAYACVLSALRLASAASVAAVRESGVLVAMVLAAVFLHERVTPWRAAGAVLVVAGVAVLSL
jgi:drug/metabolite transporter (DMT)-like permease